MPRGPRLYLVRKRIPTVSHIRKTQHRTLRSKSARIVVPERQTVRVLMASLEIRNTLQQVVEIVLSPRRRATAVAGQIRVGKAIASVAIVRRVRRCAALLTPEPESGDRRGYERQQCHCRKPSLFADSGRLIPNRGEQTTRVDAQLVEIRAGRVVDVKLNLKIACRHTATHKSIREIDE